MITIIPTTEIDQGSEEWLQLRNQYITGTDAILLLKGKSIEQILSAKQNTKPWAGNYWTQRGHEMEKEAKIIYSEVFSPVKDAGFIINDKFPYCGVSPDGLVGEDGLVEVKAFNEARHFAVYEDIEPSIIAQTQYQLFVSERDWVDLILFNPDVKNAKDAMLIKRLTPDKKIQKQFNTIFKKQT